MERAACWLTSKPQRHSRHLTTHSTYLEDVLRGRVKLLLLGVASGHVGPTSAAARTVPPRQNKCSKHAEPLQTHTPAARRSPGPTLWNLAASFIQKFTQTILQGSLAMPVLSTPSSTPPVMPILVVGHCRGAYVAQLPTVGRNQQHERWLDLGLMPLRIYAGRLHL